MNDGRGKDYRTRMRLLWWMCGAAKVLALLLVLPAFLALGGTFLTSGPLSAYLVGGGVFVACLSTPLLLKKLYKCPHCSMPLAGPDWETDSQMEKYRKELNPYIDTDDEEDSYGQDPVKLKTPALCPNCQAHLF